MRILFCKRGRLHQYVLLAFVVHFNGCFQLNIRVGLWVRAQYCKKKKKKPAIICCPRVPDKYCDTLCEKRLKSFVFRIY